MATKKQKKARTFRSSLAKSILKIQEALENCDPLVCSNPSVLQRAAKHLETPGNNGETSWRYQVNDLEFQVPCSGARQPNGTPPLLRVGVDIHAWGDTESVNYDPFDGLEVNIIVSCSVHGSEHLDTWHFDRHITNNGDAGDDNDPEDVHPLYHLQRGGARIQVLGDEVGRTLVLDPPRVAHPPLELILAIDFVISNYAGKSWRLLKGNAEYRKTIKEMQETFWGPYAATINSHFIGPTGQTAKGAVDLMPHLIA